VSTTVFLHIGTMKAGTTFIQHALRTHRDALRADGVLFPADPGYRQQVAAVRDLLHMPGPMPADELTGAWDRLSQQIAAWDGPTVLSVEYLSVAKPARIEAAMSSLAPADVHVVVTARDLGRIMPSTWQENVQNGLTWTWSEFCASVTGVPDAPPAAGDRFWNQHDLAAIVERWSAAVGRDHVHVVTVPRADAPAELLWQRFCQVIGLDAGRYPIRVNRVERNAGLDYAAAELLRRLNVALANRLNRATYAEHVKRSIAKQVLGRRLPQVPIQLAPVDLAWATARGEEVAAALSESGVDIIGDLAELIPEPTPVTSVPSKSLDTEIVEVALVAAGAAIRDLSGRPERRRTGPRGAGRRQRKSTA
jgi:hypothetical protein